MIIVSELIDLIQTEPAGVVAETLDFLLHECSLDEAPSAEEVAEEIAKDIKGVQLYEISIEHLCGKQIHEK